jgi:surface-anchored protein
VTYLQSGSFEEPEVLWTSAKDARQDFFVDVNTHTHANWVFTEPGVYLVRVSAIADLVDGGTATDTQVLRFAVGDGTSPQEALSATWRGSTQTPGSTDVAAAPTTGDDDGTLVTALVAAIAVLAVLLLVGAVVAVVRLRAQRRRALGGTDVA